MKKIIPKVINTIMNILIFYFTFCKREIWQNHIWALVFGIYAGWGFTRIYYKESRCKNE